MLLFRLPCHFIYLFIYWLIAWFSLSLIDIVSFPETEVRAWLRLYVVLGGFFSLHLTCYKLDFMHFINPTSLCILSTLLFDTQISLTLKQHQLHPLLYFCTLAAPSPLACWVSRENRNLSPNFCKPLQPCPLLKSPFKSNWMELARFQNSRPWKSQLVLLCQSVVSLHRSHLSLKQGGIRSYTRYAWLQTTHEKGGIVWGKRLTSN